MRIISYNIRGLRGLAKKKEIQKLISSQKPKVLCIQETKMEVIEQSIITWMWGSSDCDFAFKPSEGRSGGLLTIWDSTVILIHRKSIRDHLLWLEGEWGEEKKKVNIVNVYAPCDARRKRTLWLDIKNIIMSRKPER
jgi:exonuclease III